MVDSRRPEYVRTAKRPLWSRRMFSLFVAPVGLIVIALAAMSGSDTAVEVVILSCWIGSIALSVAAFLVFAWCPKCGGHFYTTIDPDD